MENWFDDAKKLYKPGVFGYRQIANELNMSVKTVESRFRREKARGNIETVEGREEPRPQCEEKDDGYVIHYGHMRRHSVFITYDSLEEALNLYCIAHLTLNQVSLKMNLTRREFYAIKTAFDITKDSMPFTPKQVDYYTAEELAEKYRIKKKQYALTKIEHNKNNDIETRIKQMDTTDFWHKQMCEAVDQIDARPYNNIQIKKSLEEIYVAYIADIHSGLVVDNYFNRYNIEIMHNRFKILAQEIINKVPGKRICLADLGDTIHGIIHGSVQKYGVWVTDATTEVIKAYECLILTLLKAKFDVTFAKVNGSHESIEKAKQERTEEESFGNFIFDMLRWKYEDFKNLHFIPRIKGLNMTVLPLFDYSTLLVHGDNGGLNQLRDSDRLFTEYNVKEINAGHLHHLKVEDFNGYAIHYNEPFSGTDQYAGNKLMSSGYGVRMVQYTKEGRGMEQLIRF